MVKRPGEISIIHIFCSYLLFIVKVRLSWLYNRANYNAKVHVVANNLRFSWE